jgi:hypothetical protein
LDLKAEVKAEVRLGAGVQVEVEGFKSLTLSRRRNLEVSGGYIFLISGDNSGQKASTVEVGFSEVPRSSVRMAGKDDKNLTAARAAEMKSLLADLLQGFGPAQGQPAKVASFREG